MQVVFEYFFVQQFVPERLGGKKEGIGAGHEIGLEVFQLFHVLGVIGRRPGPELAAVFEGYCLIRASINPL